MENPCVGSSILPRGILKQSWTSSILKLLGVQFFMRKDKEKAIKFRKQGFSYNKISALLHIPKSTLSTWLKDLPLSPKVKTKMEKDGYKKKVERLVRRNKQQTILAQQRALLIKEQAKKDVKKFMTDPLFISGIALYWAEGYKKGAYGSRWKSISFANSDPEMVAIMMKFFRKYLQIPESKFKFQIMAHENMNLPNTLKFWQSIVQSSPLNFFTTSLSLSKSSKKRLNPNTLTNGTIHIRINDVQLFFQMIGWIEGIKAAIDGA